jgi:hypothetical protein
VSVFACSASWGGGGTIEEQTTLRFAPSIGNDKSLLGDWGEEGRRIKALFTSKIFCKIVIVAFSLYLTNIIQL